MKHYNIRYELSLIPVPVNDPARKEMHNLPEVANLPSSTFLGFKYNLPSLPLTVLTLVCPFPHPAITILLTPSLLTKRNMFSLRRKQEVIVRVSGSHAVKHAPEYCHLVLGIKHDGPDIASTHSSLAGEDSSSDRLPPHLHHANPGQHEQRHLTLRG